MPLTITAFQKKYRNGSSEEVINALIESLETLDRKAQNPSDKKKLDNVKQKLQEVLQETHPDVDISDYQTLRGLNIMVDPKIRTTFPILL